MAGSTTGLRTREGCRKWSSLGKASMIAIPVAAAAGRRSQTIDWLVGSMFTTVMIPRSLQSELPPPAAADQSRDAGRLTSAEADKRSSVARCARTLSDSLADSSRRKVAIEFIWRARNFHTPSSSLFASVGLGGCTEQHSAVVATAAADSRGQSLDSVRQSRIARSRSARQPVTGISG